MLNDYFTDREPLLPRLKQAAADPPRAATRIWHIQGRRGIGKTALLKMLETFCAGEGIPFHTVLCQAQLNRGEDPAGNCGTPVAQGDSAEDVSGTAQEPG